MDIVKLISNINIPLVVLDILFLIISFLFLNKKKCSNRIKDLFVIIYTLINLFLFSYFNSMFQSVFTLKFLSVKTYLILVLIVLSIFLYTFNNKLKLVYKFINYLLVVMINVIFLVNVYVIVSNKLKVYNVMSTDNSIVLMNISLIVFLIYLILMSVSYIGYDLKSRYKVSDKNKKMIDKKIKTNKIKKVKKNLKEEVLVNDNNNNINNKKNNTIGDLLRYKVGDPFYINGVECSIIFCDSNKENILENYKKLSNDIDSKLVNGYTLNENIMIKNICNKLKVGNLGSIDINNLSILNFVSIDEYNFLKNIFDNLES